MYMLTASHLLVALPAVRYVFSAQRYHTYRRDLYAVLIATRLCSVLSDALLIGITLFITFRTRWTIRHGVAKAPLTMLLARDGTSSSER